MKVKDFLQAGFGVLIACLSLLYTDAVMAQNVRISPTSGTMICALQDGYTETGFTSGGFATWKHSQLPLTMTTSDNGSTADDFTDAGQLKDHANDLYVSDDGKYLILCGGASNAALMTITLPRGYRFTSYKIILNNNVSSAGYGDDAAVPYRQTVYFAETEGTTDRWFESKSGYVAKLDRNEDVTLERTSRSANDMGNTLYFKLIDNTTYMTALSKRGYIAATFKYIELTFTPEATFEPSLRPTSVTADLNVSYQPIQFSTGKLDLGKIKSRTSGDITRPSYYYDDVKDMPAYVDLYEGTAVTNGKIDGSQGHKGIHYYATADAEVIRSEDTRELDLPVGSDDVHLVDIGIERLHGHREIDRCEGIGSTLDADFHRIVVEPSQTDGTRMIQHHFFVNRRPSLVIDFQRGGSGLLRIHLDHRSCGCCRSFGSSPAQIIISVSSLIIKTSVSIITRESRRISYICSCFKSSRDKQRT